MHKENKTDTHSNKNTKTKTKRNKIIQKTIQILTVIRYMQGKIQWGDIIKVLMEKKMFTQKLVSCNDIL